MENAIKFFKNGQFQDAKKYAYDVLNIALDNAPASYIIAFTNEFVECKSNSMKNFFTNAKGLLLEYDELEKLMELFIQSVPRMLDFEEDILTVVSLNMQTEEQAAKLCEFVDRICPYFIGKRISLNFMTDEMVEIYGDLAEHCSVPKTCFALLKGMDTNPDSPLLNDDFTYEAKVKSFYKNYILPVGEIIGKMRSQEFRAKLMPAYNKKRDYYEKKANIS